MNLHVVVWLSLCPGHFNLEWSGFLMDQYVPPHLRDGLCYHPLNYTKCLDACFLALADDPANQKVWLALAREAHRLGYVEHAADLFAVALAEQLIVTLEIE
ncbi:MAG: hypothetical protein AB7Q00_16260 [Phycisphaerales bacterium]